jgi:hypothetical protein
MIVKVYMRSADDWSYEEWMAAQTQEDLNEEDEPGTCF